MQRQHHFAATPGEAREHPPRRSGWVPLPHRGDGVFFRAIVSVGPHDLAVDELPGMRRPVSHGEEPRVLSQG